MPASAFIGVRGCPTPFPGNNAPAPAPAPPGPDADAIEIRMTDDGTLWQGYGKYGGLEVVSQSVSGTITVYGGPDTTWPIIHQVVSPSVGSYTADDVDITDVATYIECTTIYVVHAGTSQTVDYIIYDGV